MFCVSANAQSLINYSATLFYNSSTNPKTVQVTLFVQNTNNGNGVWVDLAAIQFSLRYNTTYFTLASYSMYPSGSGLDAAGDSNSNQPDSTSTTSFTAGGKSYQSLNITRSTNICNNVLRLAPGSSTVPVFTATFNLTAAVTSNYYDFTTPSANNYPAEFQVAGSPTTTYRDILMNASSSYDQNGTSNSCQDGNIKLKSLTDDPSTPTTFTNTNAPLTVQWKNFNVQKQNNKALLSWATATEINNKGFEVQRKEGNSYSTIAFVASKSFDGNSSTLTDYTISGIDLAANQKTSFYRIKQVGYDNTVSYSEVRSINNNGRKFDLLIYPNPSHGMVNIIIPADFKEIDITLSDYSGKTLKVWNNFNKGNLSINELPKGFYLLKVQSQQTNEVVTQKVIVY
ncbi:MAG: T9SS type A sorting domain-containing protein [Sphingobacteriales bacterium]|nr:T9SS type A sorting domain-containing protein [Sphingobacteriales bacterium]